MKTYFFCYPQGPPERAGYQHQLIAIAEGLKEQGFEVLGNINYWLRSTKENDYLIKAYKTDDLNEFDVVLFSSRIIDYGSEYLLPNNLFSSQRTYKLVFIDSSDGLITPGFDRRFRNVDIILKSHYCSKYSYPQNFVPWQFGLTTRIMNYVSPVNFSKRKDRILSNFRTCHQLRDIAETISQKHFYSIFPKDSTTDTIDENVQTEINLLFWKQTGRRHYSSYYRRLGESKLSNAVGGFVQKKTTGKNGINYKIIRKFDQTIGLYRYDRVYQFDSWRFWESMLSGCCTIHLDFDKYGMRFPVMPINGIHYIGVDLDEPQKAAEILKDGEALVNISENGARWALEHYSPLAVSKRFMTLIGNVS